MINLMLAQQTALESVYLSKLSELLHFNPLFQNSLDKEPSACVFPNADDSPFFLQNWPHSRRTKRLKASHGRLFAAGVPKRLLLAHGQAAKRFWRFFLIWGVQICAAPRAFSVCSVGTRKNRWTWLKKPRPNPLEVNRHV